MGNGNKIAKWIAMLDMYDNGFSLEFVDIAESGIDCIAFGRSGGWIWTTIPVGSKQVSDETEYCMFLFEMVLPFTVCSLTFFRKDSIMGWQINPGKSSCSFRYSIPTMDCFALSLSCLNSRNDDEKT